MRAIDIISKKRNGLKLSGEEIEFMVSGFLGGDVSESQMTALLMTICFNGLDSEETSSLTTSMIHSGKTIDLSHINGVKIDKHSTGGVGDKLSLIVVPLVAATGVKAPKMSGHALGHTGGTLDKLSAVSGLRTTLSVEEFKSQLRDVGAAIVSQSSELVPADKQIYALRDQTATVSSIPLIASSIMSKKLAIGTDGIVLDVKVGSGAFMKDLNDARELSKTMVEIAKNKGRLVAAVISNMDQPLGRYVGNALEIKEAIEVLNGDGPEDVMELALTLGAEMILLAGRTDNEGEAKDILRSLLKSGEALNKFKEIIAAQGGDALAIDDPKLFETAKQVTVLKASGSGYLQFVNCQNVGLAERILSRDKSGNLVVGAGIEILKKNGDYVTEDEPIMNIYYDDVDIELAIDFLERSYAVSKDYETKPLIYEVIK